MCIWREQTTPHKERCLHWNWNANYVTKAKPRKGKHCIPCRESVRICALKLVVSLDRNNALDINNFSTWIIFNSITKKVFELLRAYIIGDNMSISGHHKKFITQTKFQRNLNSWLRFESPVSSSLWKEISIMDWFHTARLLHHSLLSWELYGTGIVWNTSSLISNEEMVPLSCRSAENQ